MTDNHIVLNTKSLKRLKREYLQAVSDGLDMFDFECEGMTHKLVTSYAKYLIQYVEMQLNNKKERGTV